MPKITVIVQARMNSTRLPGKTMMEVNGKPLIGYLLERLARCPRLETVVACPEADLHSPLGKYLLDNGHEVFFVAGDESDLVHRFVKVLQGLDACLRLPKYFLRICADSPLLDPAVVRSGMIVDRDTDSSYVWLGPRLPHGQQIERFSVQSFMRDADRIMGEAREHPGLHYGYGIAVTGIDERATFPSLAVDTREDFERIKMIIGRMTRPHWTYSWRDCLELLGGRK